MQRARCFAAHCMTGAHPRATQLGAPASLSRRRILAAGASRLFLLISAALPGPVIRVSHLTKRFGALVVVDDISFEVAAGETLVLLGPSGCGKTTLLKTLNRLIEPDGGTIEINGRDVRQQRPEELRRGIGYVIQQVGLLPHLTVAQNVGLVPGLLGQPAATTAARTTELLDRLHLPAARFGAMLPAQLSGGQQQRVGLARALAADPPVILLDEPFGALDPLTRAAVRRDFRELDELRRKTVVLVTHDVQEAFELADRIMLLDKGKIQQLGSPRELLLHPANAFVQSFFAAERLALQLRVLTLADVQPFWGALPTAPAAEPVLPLAASVQQALDTLLALATPETLLPTTDSDVPGVARREPGVARGDFGVAREDFGVARGDFGVARGDFGVAREDFGVAREEFGVAREEFGVARGEFGVARGEPRTVAVAQPDGSRVALTLPQLLAAFGRAVVAD
jgi:osmoprotectant transport system ATP-binding protein